MRCEENLVKPGDRFGYRCPEAAHECLNPSLQRPASWPDVDSWVTDDSK